MWPSFSLNECKAKEGRAIQHEIFTCRGMFFGDDGKNIIEISIFCQREFLCADCMKIFTIVLVRFIEV